MENTGIAVFAYNRPNHLRQVLERLRIIGVDHLYIFADGPKINEDNEPIEKVRNVISSIDWCDTTVVTREENIGLVKSIIQGVNKVFEERDRVIVLEDDCVPSKDFIEYARTLLDEYEDDDKVMSISGYTPPMRFPKNYPYDIFFTYRSSSWGWATWQNSWEHYEYQSIDLDEISIRQNEIENTVNMIGRDIYRMMKQDLKGEIDSWAVWWSYTIAERNGICINPVENRINNIGHDGSGTHSGSSTHYDSRSESINTQKPLSLPADPFVDDYVNRKYNRYMAGGIRGAFRKILDKWDPRNQLN